MILVFDLDDTLFDARSFYKSGNRAVAQYIAKRWKLDQETVFRKIEEIAKKNGGEKIFDKTLRHFGVYSKSAVYRCLQVFRSHNNPDIELFEDAKRCLERFKTSSKYIVTDGNKLVQHSKIVALGLEKKVKKAFVSHRHGIDRAKPSPYLFLKIAKMEKVSPQEVIYIGDNPNKDFIGIKPLGFKTLRLRRGVYSDLSLTDAHEAHKEIASLDELTQELIASL